MNPREAAAIGTARFVEGAEQRRLDRIEDIQFLISDGVHPLKVAERLGVTCAAVARQMYRADRADLARLFEAHAPKNRSRGVCRFCNGPTSRTYRTACAACGPLAQAETINNRKAA